ncbi:ATP phosphoribosyltransferase [Nitratifractor salsuginis]|uniref:ATP phosphoribosyltransferase n=1 Tax=Nitratifractor salsuginis (strain DSM 16511 / JCM 12458 / E9I37-1) TaxID=749222 RepID=E6X0S8_NITSE|nr:ATP phosphoribosyltransferase [Nitratifractor salsuginis]ADV45798.1 ATP phosphoribosyltransferase (homohexameric) [Nitratifractor salsuginis DSM 16511]
MLTIALPKGRIAEETLAIFSQLFGEGFEFESRKLILETGGFRFLNVRNQDVPTYVEYGAADLGVVGLDVITEKQLDIVDLLDLGLGRCKVAIGIPDDQELDWSRPDIRVATKMVNIAKNYFASKAVGVEVIKLYGSIELAPLVGLADAIVDIVETGTTMRENGLKVAEDIMDSSAHLIANKNSFYAKKEEILDLYGKIKAVIDSKSA